MRHTPDNSKIFIDAGSIINSFFLSSVVIFYTFQRNFLRIEFLSFIASIKFQHSIIF